MARLKALCVICGRFLNVFMKGFSKNSMIPAELLKNCRMSSKFCQISRKKFLEGFHLCFPGFSTRI